MAQGINCRPGESREVYLLHLWQPKEHSYGESAPRPGMGFPGQEVHSPSKDTGRPWSLFCKAKHFPLPSTALVAAITRLRAGQSQQTMVDSLMAPNVQFSSGAESVENDDRRNPSAGTEG